MFLVFGPKSGVGFHMIVHMDRLFGSVEFGPKSTKSKERILIYHIGNGSHDNMHRGENRQQDVGRAVRCPRPSIEHCSRDYTYDRFKYR